MKKTKKSIEKFSYPHPLVKSFSSIPEQPLEVSPPAYQNSHPSTPSTPPHRLLRCSHITPLLNSEFSLLLHPLHPGLQIPVQQKQNLFKCPNCAAILNSTSMAKLSIIRYRCKFCDGAFEVDGGGERFGDAAVVDVLGEEGQGQEDRKIVFVIEANQYLYKKDVVAEIFQCLRALVPELESLEMNKSMSEETEQTEEERRQEAVSPPGLKVGFILFDNQRSYILNLQSNQLTVLNPSQFSQPHEFPLAQSQLLQPLNALNLEQIQQILQELMYEAFMIRTTCLLPTLAICDGLAALYGVESRVFALSYDQSMLGNKDGKGKEKKDKMVVNPRVQINVFNYGLYCDLSTMGLANNICKYYEYNSLAHSNLYYSLYHNLTQETQYNVQISITTSKLIKYAKTNQEIPILTSNRSLILDFSLVYKGKREDLSSLEKKQQFQNQCIQIRMKFKNFQRILTYMLPKIGTHLYNEPYTLNDQTFFYIMVSKFLSDPKINSISKAITNKCKEIVERILTNQNQEFSIPKNLVNFFMYAFIFVQHAMGERKNVHFVVERDNFMREGLETITKRLYPKAYQFYPELKPLKFRPKTFLHNTLRLVDNGTSITLILGDEIPTETILKLLNTRNLDNALEWSQIPILQTDINVKLRKSIQILRQMNQLYFLPLRIMRFDSSQFEECFGNYLYMDEDHRQFFMKLVPK